MSSISRLNSILLQSWGYDKVVRMTFYVSKIIISLYGDTKHPRMLRFVTSLQKLSGHLASYRVITRFMGVPLTLGGMEALQPLPKGPPGDEASIVAWCSHLQCWAMLCYYPCEHMAWLTDTGVLRVREDSTPLWKTGCKFWLLYIFLNLVKQFFEIRRLRADLARRHQQTPKSDEEREERVAALRALERKKVTTALQTLNMFTDFFMCWHWSMNWSPFTEFWIGVMGVVGGSAMWKLQWESTAKS
eukprot:TRINITY_DN20726_c0_g1_i1.p2 TRINITY_DN20726_c0_g1~~TRINITY_DN20726_c0_g1_i1.p2  ORF type:complete len:245 (-),score=75.00 TRINITY_DN20726_c0_g1_i1:63-797(-)